MPSRWFTWNAVLFSLKINRKYRLLSVMILFVCVEVLRPSQLIMVMSSTASWHNHTFTWAGLVFLAVNQYLCTIFRQKQTTVINFA